MNKSRFPILIVSGLLVLLGVLAILQYIWLGQISEGERARLEKNLQTDTQRFAEDFNREMQSAYFNFQLNADVWREKRWDDFNERYKFWSEKTVYPNLIKDFYLIEFAEELKVSRYNKENKSFQAAKLPENILELKPDRKSVV